MVAHHQIGSIFWLGIGVYVAISAYRMDLGHLHDPGPGLIFFLAGLLLIILSIVDLIVAFTRTHILDKENRKKSVWVSVRWPKVLLVLGFLSAYVYFLNILGFILSTFLLLFFLFKGVESTTRWWFAIISSLTITLFSYVFFKIFLQVPFPLGILSF